MRTKLSIAQKLRSTVVVSACSIGAFVGIGIYRNNEIFYDRYLMPFSRLFSPEFCHRAAVFGFKYNIFSQRKQIDDDCLKTNFLDFTLSNPIGIAAGFDKHGEAVIGLKNAGFGFVEIGSVTPLPQPGNEKPRVFRLTEDEAIINRYGFNSIGHGEVFTNLLAAKRSPNYKNVVLGVNLGKNKDSTDAAADYEIGIKVFIMLADYFVINVSSPNTAGLRNLQHKNDLKQLLSKVVTARDSTEIDRKTPILLKIAPDLTDNDLNDIVSVITTKGCRIDGIIVSNTTIERPETLKSAAKSESGGLSGRPLTQRSTVLIAKLYKKTKGKIPIIGVGGVFTGQDAFDKIAAGANVVQLYTSMIIHGPPVVQKVKRELADILKANGFKSVEEVRGKKADFWSTI